MASHIDLKPLAPNLYSRALFTIKSRASDLKIISIPSNLNNLIYCLVKAFFGSTKILLRVSKFKSFK